MGDHPSDEHVVCNVCRDGGWTEQNMIVFCEGPCGITVHQKCYGVLEIPEGDIPWYCDVCAPDKPGGKPKVASDEHFCILCLGRGGAMKEVQPESKRWIHVACAMAAPEVYFHDAKRLHGVDGIDSMALSRRRQLGCVFCSVPNGMCVQCSGPNCDESFHVRCGQDHGFKVELKPKASRKRAYCAKHLYLFGQHEALSNSRNSPRQTGTAVAYSGSSFACSDLWSELSSILDAESQIVDYLKGSSLAHTPVDPHTGSKRGRKNYERERATEAVNRILVRDLPSRPFESTDMLGTGNKILKRRKSKVTNPNQRSWVKAQYAVQNGNMKASSKPWFNHKTPFAFRCAIDDSPPVSKRLGVMSLQGSSFVEPKQGTWTADGDESLEQELWRLQSALKCEIQANSLRVHKIKNTLQPGRASQHARSIPQGNKQRAAVRPKKNSARKKGKVTGLLTSEAFLAGERDFMNTLIGLRKNPQPKGVDHEIGLVLEYMVCKIASYTGSGRGAYIPQKLPKRSNKKKSGNALLLSFRCIGPDKYECH